MITIHAERVVDPRKFTSVVYCYRFDDDGQTLLRVSDNRSTNDTTVSDITDMIDKEISAEDILAWVML